MIYVFPYTNYETISSLKKEVILGKFCSSASIMKTLTITKTNSYKDFDGVLFNDGFKLRRIFKIGYSAFMPILSCKIIEEEQSLCLKVNIQFHKYVNVLLIVFYLILISGFNFGSINMLILTYSIVMYFYNTETKILKEELDKIIGNT